MDYVQFIYYCVLLGFIPFKITLNIRRFYYMKMQRIRDLREDNDLKQIDIADYLHISQRTYSHYETNSRSMPVEMLKRLALYYNTSMESLFLQIFYNRGKCLCI